MPGLRGLCWTNHPRSGTRGSGSGLSTPSRLAHGSNNSTECSGLFFGWLSVSSLRVQIIGVIPRLINLRLRSRSIQKVKHPHLRLKKARSQNWDERPDLMSPNMRCRSADHTPTHGRGNGKARSPQEVAAEPGVPGGLG